MNIYIHTPILANGGGPKASLGVAECNTQPGRYTEPPPWPLGVAKGQNGSGWNHPQEP